MATMPFTKIEASANTRLSNVRGNGQRKNSSIPVILKNTAPVPVVTPTSLITPGFHSFPPTK